MVPAALSFVPSDIVQFAVVVGSMCHLRTGVKQWRRIKRHRDARADRDFLQNATR
jgi:hypothetical protein